MPSFNYFIKFRKCECPSLRSERHRARWQGRMAGRRPHLGMAASSGPGVTLALVAAVGTPREVRTGQVTGGAEASRVTLAESKESVAAHVGTHHRAPLLTLLAVVP